MDSEHPGLAPIQILTGLRAPNHLHGNSNFANWQRGCQTYLVGPDGSKDWLAGARLQCPAFTVAFEAVKKRFYGEIIIRRSPALPPEEDIHELPAC